MLKGFFLYYLLSRLTGNPILGLALLVFIYFLLDKTYLGFLPDFLRPFRRNTRINTLLSDIKVNPANANAAQELGILYFEKKQYRKSLVFLQKAHEKVKNSARLYLYMGMAYMELGEREDGRTALVKALELDRKVGRGLPHIYLLQYAMASNCQSVPEIEAQFTDFSNTENLYRMGMVYKKAGLIGEAREMFRCALEDYAYVPKNLRRIHRKWAILSRIRLFM
ncbi:MAG TPA: hypothetical protein VNT57_01120 [Desulfobacteria bacterium]|nr:hypothetical protein [Desulfobacteria bacterium]